MPPQTRAQCYKKRKPAERELLTAGVAKVDTLDAAPPMYKTKQGQRSYRTPDFLNGSQAYTRFLLPLWNINKNADCIAIGIFVRVRKKTACRFFSRLNTLGLQFNHAYTSVIVTIRIIIFDFICVAEIRRQGESSFLIAKQFFTQTEKRGHVPLRVIFPGDFLYQIPCCFC